MYTDNLRPGRYSIEFWFHARGDGIGGLNVYTRKADSQFNRLIWYYSKRFNGSATEWTSASVEVNQQTTFQVCKVFFTYVYVSTSTNKHGAYVQLD